MIVRPKRVSVMLAYTLPLLLAVALYGYALRMPYFLDDGAHFVILGQTDGLQQWGDFDIFPFYRPLTFSVWKAFTPIGYAPFGLHALNLFTFGMVGVLVGQIARLLAPKNRVTAALIAGCGFVLFPFSVQAVVMVAAYFHLMLAFGVTMSVLFALRDSVREHPSAILLTGFGAFVAAFSHESGVIVALLVPMAWMLRARRILTRRAFLRLVLPVWTICTAYLLLWWGFAPNEEARTLSSDIPAATAALLQGLIYPVFPLIRPIIVGDASPALILALVVGGVAVALAVLRRQFALWPAAYGVLWYALAIFPAVLLLPAGYVLGQLRLASLASVGTGIFWGIGLSALRGRPGAVIRLALVLLAIIVSLDYLALRRADFLRLADWNAAAVALVDDQRGGVVVVNPPQNLTPLESNRRFLLGSEGVLWTDIVTDYSQQFWMNGADDLRGVQAVSVPALVGAVGTQYTAHGDTMSDESLYALLRGAELILSTQFMPDGSFYPALVGGEWVERDSMPPFDGVRYPEIGAELLTLAAFLHADGRLEVLSRWRMEQPAPVKLFMQVYDCGGQRIAQNDGYVWGNLLPFRAWYADETHTDRRVFHLPDHTDCVELYMGLYDENTGARQTAYQADAQLPDNALIVTVSAKLD